MTNLNTINQIGPDEIFSDDISGLFIPIQPVKILDKVVRYKKPGVSKLAFVANFFTEGLTPYLFTPNEQQHYSYPERFKACREYIENLSKTDMSLYEDLLGRLFLSKEFHEYLVPLLDLSFPDLSPLDVTDECFVAMMEVVVGDTFSEINEMAKTAPGEQNQLDRLIEEINKLNSKKLLN